MVQINFIPIGTLVAEIFMFELVNGGMDGRMHARAPAFVSGELKSLEIHFSDLFNCIVYRFRRARYVDIMSRYFMWCFMVYC